MKLARFISLHKKFFIFIFTITMIICSHFLLDRFLNWPTLPIVIIDVVLYFFIYVLVVFSSNMFFSKPIAELNNKCDPYPLLEESEKHLKAYFPISQKIWFLINYSVALKCTGQPQKALEVLLSINMEDDVLKKMLPLKVTYYIRLASLCFDLNKEAQADFAYSKFLELIPEIKKEREKKLIETDIVNGKVFDAFRKGDYQLVIETYEGYVYKTFSSQVSAALDCAKAYLAMGETEKAKEKLEFVIENGNKLYSVTEAREILSNL